MQSGRREFLKKATGATAAIAVGPALMGVTSVGAASAPAPGPVSPQGPKLAPAAGGQLRPALELEGVAAGFPQRTEGGEAFIDVVEFVDGDDPGSPQKSCGRLRFEEITVEMGLNMEPPVYDWIDRTLKGDRPRHDGALIGFDSRGDAQARREFRDALISEVAFPALDAASKDAAFMTVKISPESTRFEGASGAVGGVAPKKQKQWLASNFRVKVGGLPTSRVNKIESILVKQQIVAVSGEDRFPRKLPGRLDFPNLVLSLSATDASEWRRWHEDFVINGNCGSENEEDGVIEFLDPSLKVLATLELHNLGIVRLTDDPWEANGDKVARITVEMYVEGMRLFVGNLS